MQNEIWPLKIISTIGDFSKPMTYDDPTRRTESTQMPTELKWTEKQKKKKTEKTEKNSKTEKQKDRQIVLRLT